MMPELMDYYDYEVTKLIMEKYAMKEMEALRAFLGSRTHEMLADPAYWLAEYGPAGILDIWEAERVTGDPSRSAYMRGDAS